MREWDGGSPPALSKRGATNSTKLLTSFNKALKSYLSQFSHPKIKPVLF